MTSDELEKAHTISCIVNELNHEIADLNKVCETIVTDDHNFKMKLEFTQKLSPIESEENKGPVCDCGDPNCKPLDLNRVQAVMGNNGRIQIVPIPGLVGSRHENRPTRGEVEFVPNDIASIQIIGIIMEQKVELRDMYLGQLKGMGVEFK